MGLPVRDSERHTYSEYVTWTGDARYELIDGIGYLMAPAPSADHQTFVTEIAFQARAALGDGGCRVFVAPIDVRLPRGSESDGETDTVVQPDLLVVCDSAKIDAKGIRGAPDWVVEVLSPRSAGHDQITKRATYERAGVREYWLVHPTDRVLTIYRRSSEGRFAMPEIVELHGEMAVSVLAGVRIAWAPILSRLVADVE